MMLGKEEQLKINFDLLGKFKGKLPLEIQRAVNFHLLIECMKRTDRKVFRECIEASEKTYHHFFLKPNLNIRELLCQSMD